MYKEKKKKFGCQDSNLDDPSFSEGVRGLHKAFWEASGSKKVTRIFCNRGFLEPRLRWNKDEERCREFLVKVVYIKGWRTWKLLMVVDGEK